MLPQYNSDLLTTILYANYYIILNQVLYSLTCIPGGIALIGILRASERGDVTELSVSMILFAVSLTTELFLEEGLGAACTDTLNGASYMHRVATFTYMQVNCRNIKLTDKTQ